MSSGQTEQLTRNVVDNITEPVKDIAYSVSSGNYSNIGNTLLTLGVRNQASAATGGAAQLLDPSVTRVGKGTVARAKDEAAAKATAEASQLAADEKQKKLDAVNNVINQVASARGKTPGRASTLLTTGYSGSGNTLLTRRS